jgi:flavin reductase (DIM6/NTAB) family NADH-FMN oxidoreductase RutF
VSHGELIGPFPEGADPQHYDQLRRRVLWAMPHGLFLLASRAGERRNLMATSLVSQLCTDPKLLGVVVETGAVTHQLISEGGAFALVLLAREQRTALRRFVKPAAHDAVARTLAGEPYTDAAVTGVPIPDLGAAFLDCRLERRVELGSHDLFIGEVVDAGVRDDEALGALLRMEDTRMNYGG